MRSKAFARIEARIQLKQNKKKKYKNKQNKVKTPANKMNSYEHRYRSLIRIGNRSRKWLNWPMVEQKKRVNIIGEKQKRDYRTNRVTVT